MTENQYLDVSNLTRLRAAISILGDCTFLDDVESTTHLTAVKALVSLQLSPENRVIVSEEEDPK